MSIAITPHTEDLCLVVTERCNLHCTYCQSNKSFSRTMSWECAKAYIDKYLTVCDTLHPSFTFMGGEPFIAFTLIKTIVDYVKANYPRKQVTYTIVTNGTLVHRDIQHWILLHEDQVHVTLSLDGLGEEHDINRCDSLKRIDLEFFRQLRNPVVNTVFTPETVDRMAATTIALQDKGFMVKGFVADGEKWVDRDVNIFAQQLALLIDYYMEHPQIPPMSLLAQPIYYLIFAKGIRRCGTSDYTEVSVSADGRLWACHRCSPFENHGSWKIPEHLLSLSEAKHLLEECKDCRMEKICNVCPASNASIMEDKKLAETTCAIRKLLFKANAYFVMNMLASETEYAGIRHLDAQRRIQTFESAKAILNLL